MRYLGAICLPEANKPRTVARRTLIEESKAEVDDERIQREKHETDLSERMFSDWPAYAGSTRYGPVTGSTYGGGGGLWRRRYYWVVVWLVLVFSAFLVAFLVILVLLGRI
jgi:hypothetical protein